MSAGDESQQGAAKRGCSRVESSTIRSLPAHLLHCIAHYVTVAELLRLRLLNRRWRDCITGSPSWAARGHLTTTDILFPTLAAQTGAVSLSPTYPVCEERNMRVFQFAFTHAVRKLCATTTCLHALCLNGHGASSCITLESIRHIAACPSLRTLRFSFWSNTVVTGDMIAALAHSSLTALHMVRCKTPSITDAAIRALARGCSTLSLLDISHCTQRGITDASFEALAQCPALHTLRMRACTQPGITDAAFAALTSCATLTELDMTECSQPTITSAAFRSLAQYASLRVLRATDCHRLHLVTSVAALGDSETLQVLDIGDGARGVMAHRQNHRSIRALMRCRTLTHLSLTHGMGVLVHPATIAMLGVLPALSVLDLSGAGGVCSVTDGALVTLATCPVLHTLVLDGCITNKITDAGICALARCPQLATLSMSQQRTITDGAFRGLVHFPGLTSLNVTASSDLITSAAFDALARCARLAHLDVSSCRWVTDVGIRALATSRSLTHLDMSHCQNEGLSLSVFSAFGAYPKLRRLDMVCCFPISLDRQKERYEGRGNSVWEARKREALAEVTALMQSETLTSLNIKWIGLSILPACAVDSLHRSPRLLRLITE